MRGTLFITICALAFVFIFVLHMFSRISEDDPIEINTTDQIGERRDEACQKKTVEGINFQPCRNLLTRNPVNDLIF